MKNILLYTLLLFAATGCKKEADVRDKYCATYTGNVIINNNAPTVRTLDVWKDPDTKTGLVFVANMKADLPSANGEFEVIQFTYTWGNGGPGYTMTIWGNGKFTDNHLDFTYYNQAPGYAADKYVFSGNK